MNSSRFVPMACFFSTVAALGAIACSGNSTGGVPPGSGGSGASHGTGGSSTNCVTDRDCECDDGRRGETECTDDTEVCNCDQCPQMEDELDAEFVACGGDPFGAWRMTNLDASRFTLTLYRQVIGGYDIAGTCGTNVILTSDAIDFRLVLEDGGTGAMRIDGGSLEFNLLDACVYDALQDSCTDLDLQSGGACEVVGCGVCTCDTQLQGLDERISWSRTDGTLDFETGSDPLGSFDYCVEGETMSLHDVGTGLVVELERGVFTGVPTPCAERTLAECELGYGCSPGVCIGDGTCAEGTSESSCTNRVGCTWDTSQCGGAGRDECRLDEYGTVPGCLFLTGTGSACSGTPLACSTLAEDQCWRQPGCETRSACAGGPILCAQYGAPCPDGCTESGINCTGYSDCSEQDQYGCDRYDGCTWAECTGTPTGCDLLDAATCATAPGCELS